MTDRLCRGLLPHLGLRAAFVRVGDTARMARVLHGLHPTHYRSAVELAEASGAPRGTRW